MNLQQILEDIDNISEDIKKYPASSVLDPNSEAYKLTEIRLKLESQLHNLIMQEGIMTNKIYGVPGTDLWMRFWRAAGETGQQEKLAAYAREIRELEKKKFSKKTITEILKDPFKTYLRYKKAVAYAKRENEVELINKLNRPLEEKEKMSKKKEEITKEAARERAINDQLLEKINELTELVISLKKELKSLKPKEEKEKEEKKSKNNKRKEEGEKNKNKKKENEKVNGKVKDLLEKLQEAKEKGNKKEAAKIRRQLRKAGYSLRQGK